MATGHVGAEYVEYVLRHKKGLSPTHTPLRLGNEEVDGIRVDEPDLSPIRRAAQDARPGRSTLGELMKDDELELLLEKLRSLKLPGMAARSASCSPRRRKKNLTPLEVGQRLCDEERKSRVDGAIKRRVRDARFPEVNTVAAFDFDFDPCRKKLKARYLALHDLAFLGRGINPLFIGHPGTGKTFLARALAYRACQSTRRVVFTSSPKTLNELVGAEIHGALDKVMRRYVKADPLVLDDFAVLAMDPTQAKLAFQVVSERYDYRRRREPRAPRRQPAASGA